LVDVFIGYSLDKVEDKKRLLEWIDENVRNVEPGQQRISEDEQESGWELATPKQRALMDKHKITYDSGTSKVEASSRISSFFDSHAHTSKNWDGCDWMRTYLVKQKGD